jgi:hypothetical protein
MSVGRNARSIRSRDGNIRTWAFLLVKWEAGTRFKRGFGEAEYFFSRDGHERRAWVASNNGIFPNQGRRDLGRFVERDGSNKNGQLRGISQQTDLHYELMGFFALHRW